MLLKHDLTSHGNVSVKEELMKGKVVCETCGKMFSSQTILNSHAVGHSKEHPFQCEMCQRNFKWLYELRVHKKVDTQDNHVCDVCTNKTIHKSALEIHQKRHV